MVSRRGFLIGGGTTAALAGVGAVAVAEDWVPGTERLKRRFADTSPDGTIPDAPTPRRPDAPAGDVRRAAGEPLQRGARGAGRPLHRRARRSRHRRGPACLPRPPRRLGDGLVPPPAIAEWARGDHSRGDWDRITPAALAFVGRSLI